MGVGPRVTGMGVQAPTRASGGSRGTGVQESCTSSFASKPCFKKESQCSARQGPLKQPLAEPHKNQSVPPEQGIWCCCKRSLIEPWQQVSHPGQAVSPDSAACTPGPHWETLAELTKASLYLLNKICVLWKTFDETMAEQVPHPGQVVSPESAACTPGLHYSTDPGTAELSHLPSVPLHLFTHKHPDDMISYAGVGMVNVHEGYPCLWLKISMTGVGLVMIVCLCDVWKAEQRCP